MPSNPAIDMPSAEILVGRRLRELRIQQGYSLRELALRSGLNINTLSLIENGKSSPSVATLQQLAQALGVPMATFFEKESLQKRVVFTSAEDRPEAAFGAAQMQHLGKNLAGNVVQPFVVTLKPGMGSGEQRIVHTGHEFVYCLSGHIQYQILQERYDLKTGDSLVFEAHLPHCWKNTGMNSAQILLVLYPADDREEIGGRHFSIQGMQKETHMKIAVITEDGKTISKHFGRAPYYMVLTIEDGKVIQREQLAKKGHHEFHSEAHGGESHGAGHGMDAASHDRHAGMAEAIRGCQVLICGGMGMGAYESMRRLAIQPIVTDEHEIDAAVQAYLDGKLVDHIELLH